MAKYTLTVNGKTHSVDAEPDMPLLYALRNEVGMKEPRFGCGLAQCGACTVLMNGVPIKSCVTLAVQADGAQVTTIEGLAAADGTLHPMQEMFREHHALQCGFCTPGMVMSAIDLVMANPGGLTEQQIREGLEGNLCRCTGYHNIVQSVLAAAKK